MTTTLKSLQAIPLTASFAKAYGGEDRVPEEVRRPASHFQSIPRIGQYTTFVFAESSDGMTGLGECFGLPTPHAAAAMINHVITPAIVGRPLADPEEMLASLNRYFAALGHTKGPGMEALSGVDIALWDLKARREGQSLSACLGTAPRPMPTYVSPVPFLPTPQRTAEAATRASVGYKGVKLKIGRGVATDIAHITAVRDAIGPDRQLMLDANCGYSFDGAVDLLNELKGLNIAWLEEPLPPDNVAELRRLADIAELPLAGGENEFSPDALARLIETAQIQIVQPNISRAGGVTGMLAIDRIARDRHVTVAPHGVGASVVVAATLHCAAAMQAFLSFEINRLPNPLRDELGSGPILDSEGNALPPEGIGHGVGFDITELTEFVESA